RRRNSIRVRHQVLRVGVLQLPAQFRRGVLRIDGRHDAANQRDGVKGDRVLRKIRTVDRKDITLAKSTARQAGRTVSYGPGPRAIRQRAAARAVDEGSLV